MKLKWNDMRLTHVYFWNHIMHMYLIKQNKKNNGQKLDTELAARLAQCDTIASLYVCKLVIMNVCI